MRVQVTNPNIIPLNNRLNSRRRNRSRRLATATIILRSTLCTIAVDVHVGESAAFALEVDYAVVGEVVAAV